MRTTLTPEQLAGLAAQGRAEAARSRFVNPYSIAKVERILQTRGEDWAAGVLMRDLTRRSLIDARFPWFENGECETLVLADATELAQLERAAEAAEGIEGDLS